MVECLSSSKVKQRSGIFYACTLSNCRRAVGDSCVAPCLNCQGTFHVAQGHYNGKRSSCVVNIVTRSFDTSFDTSFDVSKTMQYPKKYLTEGLIQMTILLSLCGLLVDVGLEPYLPSSWHERILGPTSALTQTQFHNLRNRLEDGHGLHPKHVDLDSFFTAHRLLGWVRSLDRLQVGKCPLFLGIGKVCFHFQPVC